MPIILPVGVSGAQLNVKAYAAVSNLPATANEGAIAVITSTAIGNSYAAAEAPSAPSSGDIWVLLGSDSLAPVMLSDSITISPRAAYQYNGSSWGILETYVYTGSAWVEITLLVYDTGNFYFGNSLSMTSYRKTSDSLTLLANTIRFKVTGDVNGADWTWAHTTQVVDVTGISQIRVNFSFSSSRGHGILQLASARSSAATVASVSLSYGEGTKTLNVASYSGNYYIGIEFYDQDGDPEPTQYGYFTLIGLEK